MSRRIKTISFSSPRSSGVLAFLAVLLCAISTSAGEIKKSPQVLALVSIERPIELLCHNGDCFVELSAFCLQADYATPKRGTRYQVAGFGGIRVTGYTPEGVAIRLDPAKYFDLTALRTHVAVRMSTPSKTLKDMNIARVEVSVAPHVSLVALPSNEYQPQSDVSVAVATGPWRAIGDQIVDRNQEQMSAARITSRIANRLPPMTHVDHKTTRALWSDLQSNGSLNSMRPSALRMLSEAYRECEGKDGQGGMTTMRECVSHMHDRFLGGLNTKYWEAIRGAS